MSRCLSGVLGKAAKACRGAHWDVGVAPVGSGKDGGSVADVPQSRDQASPDGAPRRGWVSCALRSGFPRQPTASSVSGSLCFCPLRQMGELSFRAARRLPQGTRG